MARDEQEVFVVERDNGGGGLKWLILGAAVGAGLALLFAPRSGKDLRRELGKGIRNLRDFADDTIEELKGQGDDDEGDLRSMADGGGAYDDDDAEQAETPISRKRPSAIAAREELERRLEAARARRRHVIPDDEEPVA